MPRYTAFLAEGMQQRGHKIEVWYPNLYFSSIKTSRSVQKWLGYVDQYIFFPITIKGLISQCEENTLFVFTDHALGPWVHMVKDLPHVIHCHDFLAQQSALNKIPENRVSFTGKKYQAFIRRGFRKGKNFISVSKYTKKTLHTFLTASPLVSEVVYNAVNPIFKQIPVLEARAAIQRILKLPLEEGYILHVGGNQWYKNRKGVIEIFNNWRHIYGKDLKLLLIGEKLSKEIAHYCDSSPFKTSIYVLPGLDDYTLNLAYSAASVFLFPSLAEGFGWPIIEAMASGCPVITTAEAPMTEVAGSAAFLIEKKKKEKPLWAASCAEVLNKVVDLNEKQKNEVVLKGLENAKRFEEDKALNQIEKIYRKILCQSLSQ